MACHTANLAFKALKFGLPQRVSAVSGEINPETYPAWATMTYEFPAREDLPPVKFTWYEGAKEGQRNLPNADLLQGEKVPDSGMIFIGEKGSILTPSDYGSDQVLLPRKQFADFQRPKPTIERLGRYGCLRPQPKAGVDSRNYGRRGAHEQLRLRSDDDGGDAAGQRRRSPGQGAGIRRPDGNRNQRSGSR